MYRAVSPAYKNKIDNLEGAGVSSIQKKRSGCVKSNSESTITFNNPTRLNQPSSHFTLSPTSGELRTSSRLDREGRDGADSRDLVALSSSPTYPIEASHPLLNLFSLNKCSEGEPIMWVRGGVEDMSEHLGRH